jgi:dihydroflavonol-4-reductase
MIVDFAKGKLTAAIRGGYDFVDVRDVAGGIISLALRKDFGQTYLLTNQFYEVTELLGMLHQITGRRKIKTILPLWFAKGTAALSELYYKILKQAPLYTSYSLYTLGTNAVFSHEKADRLLGFTNRSMEETLIDTIDWMKSTGRLKP